MSKFVYTLSSKKDMVEQCVVSVRSLLNFVDAGDVVVFFTPPVAEEDVELFESMGVDVRRVENVSEPTERTLGGEVRRFGEKLHLCDVESDTVVFLDCDTVVLGDPVEVIEGDFDFKARPGDLPFDRDSWRSAFEEEDLGYVDWMPNAGFMVFKNGVHREVADEWRSHFEKGADGHGLEGPFTEQHALSFCLGDYSLNKMSSDEHVFLWNGEKSKEGFVYHYGHKWNTPEGRKERIKNCFKAFLGKLL